MLHQRSMLVPFLMATTLSLLEPVSAYSISAWYAKGLDAPQIVMYDPKVGKIYYSLCNSKETPVFPYDDSTTLSLIQKPMANTTVAGTAGYEGTALIHYQDEGGGIVQAIFTCDQETGHWNMEPGQSWIVTAGTPVIPAKAIKNGTDLTVLTLNTNGHRVFYKDFENRPGLLEYRPGTGTDGNGEWANGGLVSQDNETASSIGAAFVGNGDITVVMATNANDTFEIMAKTLDGSEWTLSSYPLELSDADNTTAYPTNTTAMDDLYWTEGNYGPGQLEALTNEADIGVGYLRDDGGDFQMNIFYIGTDSRLHQNYGKLYKDYSIGARQNTSIWPTADEPNSRLGLTSFADTGDLWIYYISGGNMTQVYMKDREWQPHKTLDKVPPEVPADSNDSSSTQGGLSQAQKIGIGVGVGLGVPLIAALLLYYFFVFTKKSRAEKDNEQTASQNRSADSTSQEAKGVPPSTDTKNAIPSNAGTPAPRYTSGNWGDAAGMWVDGQWVPNPHTGVNPSQENQWAGWQQNGQHSSDPASRFSEMSAMSPIHGQGTGNSNRVSELFAQQPIYEMPQQDRAPQELATQQHQRDQAWEVGANEARLSHNVSPPPAAGSPPPPQAVSPMPTGSSTVGAQAPSEVHEKSAG